MAIRNHRRHLSGSYFAFASSNRRRFDPELDSRQLRAFIIKAQNPMKFAVQVEADDAEALDRFVAATEKWLKSMGATVLESTRDDEDLTAAYVVSTRKDLSSTFVDANLPGKVSVEPLD